MDEKEFLTLIQNRVDHLLGDITNREPLAGVYLMLRDRLMVEKQFLTWLEHAVEGAKKQIAIQAPLDEISRMINDRLTTLP
jgi:hypothetical protein